MGDCPEEYLEFHDTEDEYLDEYKTNGAKRVIMPDGRLLAPWDEQFRVEGSFGIGSDTHKVPKGLKVKQIPFKKIYPTFEQFVKEWHGTSERDAQTGRYGYWENPNAKWDWYQLGGRWRGFFKLKAHVAADSVVVGEAGVFDNKAEPRTADQCEKGMVDWEAMMAETAAAAGKRFNAIKKAVAGRNYTSWSDMRDKYEDIDIARKKYHAQKVVKDVTKLQVLHYSEDFDDILKMGRKAFMRSQGEAAITPFAVVYDGQWIEKGEMGWWGVTTNEKDCGTWFSMFKKVLDGLPDDTLLSLYDCHI